MPQPPAEEKLPPKAAVPVEFDTLLTQTKDHAAVRAIISALRKLKIEAFRSTHGKRVGAEAALAVRAADMPKASVVAAEISVRRKKINAITRIEQPTDPPKPDLNFNISF